MFDKLVEVIVQFIHLFFFSFVIMDYQRGVVLRFGKFHREVGPGFHFRCPFHMERVFTANVVIETKSVGPQSLTTKDGKSIVISTIVTFFIEDVKKFLLSVEGGHQVVEDATYGQVSDFILAHTWDEMCQIKDLPNELAKTVRRRAKDYGVGIVRVQVSDFTLCKSLRLVAPLAHGSHAA